MHGNMYENLLYKMAQSHQPEISFCLLNDLNANVQKNISSILHLHIFQSAQASCSQLTT